ncbi:MAG: TraR/DksA family transcriptional regulator [Kiritimatiellia bacterium]
MAKGKSLQKNKTRSAKKGASRKSGSARATDAEQVKNAAKTVAKSGTSAPGGKRLSERDREFFRQRLLEMRERLTRQINSLTAESLQRPDSVNSEEDGTDAFDRQFALNLASSENESVHDIEEALLRLDEGTYGICDVCNSVIERQRLEALPFVRTCIKCQAEREKRQGGVRALRRFL